MKRLGSMTFFVIISSLTMFASIYSNDWESHWIHAVECCSIKDYTTAEMEFGLAIQSIEKQQDEDHYHVYIDRARLYCLQDRFEEALVDVNKGLCSEKLTTTDKTRGLLTRMCASSNLNNEEQFVRDYEEFRATSTHFPKVEFTQDRVIIRNVPKSKCYREITKAFLISAKICEKESDIIEIAPGVIVAKRIASQCHCEAPSMNLDKQSKLDKINKCNWWCDKNAIAGGVWCGRAFKGFGCQLICVAAVEVIREGCYWCCNGGNAYQKCLEPFGNIIGRMGEGCDPMWD